MATQTRLDQQVLKEVERYAKNLKKAGVNFQKLIVFGSHAKGTTHQHSDIDLGVISKNFGKNRHNERVLLMKHRNRNTINIEPHPMGEEEIKSKWSLLGHEIRKHGIEVRLK